MPIKKKTATPGAKIKKTTTNVKPKSKPVVKPKRVNVRLVQPKKEEDVIISSTPIDMTAKIERDADIVNNAIQEDLGVVDAREDDNYKKEIDEINELDMSESEKNNISPTRDLYEVSLPDHMAEDAAIEVVENETDKDGAADEVKHASVGLYRNIAFVFMFLTFVLLGAIFYFSFVKVKITVTAKEEKIGDNMIVDIYNESSGSALASNEFSGVVEKNNISDSGVYKASGQEVVGEEAIGTVTIFNNYIKNQPLVATTRLLTADNKLFRIKNTVNIPVGGSVDVEVYADDPGPEMAINKARFTIPGLWAGLQDKVYAEVKEPIVYKQKIKTYILQADIDNAVSDLEQKLLNKAKEENASVYGNYDQVMYSLDNNSVEVKVDGKAKEERDDFNLTIKADVVVVAFNDDKIIKAAEDKLYTRVPSDKKIISFDNSNITYSLNSFNVDEGIASVNSVFEGIMTISDGSELIDKNSIVGLNYNQLKDYLDGVDGIVGYDIEFSPYFIKKVPSLADRITVEIKN